MNLHIRVCAGVLAATGTFIETTFPMRRKPRVMPGLENVAAWPDGEHALVEAEAGRDVSEPQDGVYVAPKLRPGLLTEGLAETLGVREAQKFVAAFGGTSGEPDERNEHLGPYTAPSAYEDDPIADCHVPNPDEYSRELYAKYGGPPWFDAGAREAQVRAGGFGGINGMPPTTTCADVAAALQNIPQGPPPPGEPQLTDDELVAVRQLLKRFESWVNHG